MTTNADVVEQLTRALEAVPRLKELARRSPERVVGSREFQQWREDTVAAIADAFGSESSEAKSFAGIQYAPVNFYFGASDDTFRQIYFRGLDVAATAVQSMIDELGKRRSADEERRET